MATAVVSPAPATSARSGKRLHLALWGVQVLLAALFGMAGFMKSTAPFAELTRQMPWAAVVGEATTRFIGVSQLVGAIGLLLPALTRIWPRLTALAGAGLAVVMLLAAGYHVVHGEWQALPMNFVLGGLAAFVAWGRFRAAPITPR